MNPYLQMLMNRGAIMQHPPMQQPMPPRPPMQGGMQGQQMPQQGGQSPYASMLQGAPQNLGMMPQGQPLTPQAMQAMRTAMAQRMMNQGGTAGPTPTGLPRLPQMGLPTGGPKQQGR